MRTIDHYSVIFHNKDNHQVIAQFVRRSDDAPPRHLGDVVDLELGDDFPGERRVVTFVITSPGAEEQKADLAATLFRRDGEAGSLLKALRDAGWIEVARTPTGAP